MAALQLQHDQYRYPTGRQGKGKGTALALINSQADGARGGCVRTLTRDQLLCSFARAAGVPLLRPLAVSSDLRAPSCWAHGLTAPSNP